jgi:hypothetical protein
LRPDSVTYETAKLSEKLVSTQFHLITAQKDNIRLPAHFSRNILSVRTLYRVKELATIASQSFGDYRLRYITILTNRYIGAFFSPYWYIVTVSMLLRRFVPSATVKARAIYHRILGYQRIQ